MYGSRTSELLKNAFLALASTIAGSQFVHTMYRPLDSLDTMVEEEYGKLKEQAKKQ